MKLTAQVSLLFTITSTISSMMIESSLPPGINDLVVPELYLKLKSPSPFSPLDLVSKSRSARSPRGRKTPTSIPIPKPVIILKPQCPKTCRRFKGLKGPQGLAGVTNQCETCHNNIGSYGKPGKHGRRGKSGRKGLPGKDGVCRDPTCLTSKSDLEKLRKIIADEINEVKKKRSENCACQDGRQDTEKITEPAINLGRSDVKYQPARTPEVNLVSVEDISSEKNDQDWTDEEIDAYYTYVNDDDEAYGADYGEGWY